MEFSEATADGMRWFAVTQQFCLTPEDMYGVYFVPGVFKFSEIGQRIRHEMAGHELALVVVDTSAAYFEADDENSNVQVGAHAWRLRQLIQMQGGPVVLVCCHPAKAATDENLLPGGGGVFLAEVDGNLVCKKDDSTVQLYTHGKFRGPDFAPLSFLLRTVTHERLKDAKGRLIPTVVAEALSEEGLRDISARNRDDENQVLQSIAKKPQSHTARPRNRTWLVNAKWRSVPGPSPAGRKGTGKGEADYEDPRWLRTHAKGRGRAKAPGKGGCFITAAKTGRVSEKKQEPAGRVSELAAARLKL